MEKFLSNPVFGILVYISTYALGCWIKGKVKSNLFNPLVFAATFVILLILFTPLTLEALQAGGSIITLFIAPATICLALRIHQQWDLLKTDFLPVLVGCFVGSAAAIGSIWGMCRIFLIDETITASLLPKSVTTAIAIELSEKVGGIGAITLTAVVFTGILCSLVSPLLLKLLKLKDPVSTGVAFGVSGHAVGTSRALEIGDTQGAMGGISLCLAGIITSILFLFF